MTQKTEKLWDLVVIGGGAAGFFGALAAAESADKPMKVLILEKSPNLLGKVRISGGGRCNLTHACFEPRTFATHFPRGEKALIGPLNRWSAQDTIDWFENHGVQLKREADGRMFPTSDKSQTIIDCLMDAAQAAGVTIWTKAQATSITHESQPSDLFSLQLAGGTTVLTKQLLMATGGTRSADTKKLIHSLGHTTQPAVPSLFTFNIPGQALKELAGLSVAKAVLRVPDLELNSTGPLLVTHWGLSGPAVLKLSAWGARALHGVDYQFTLHVNWLPEPNIQNTFDQLRASHGKRLICSRSPFTEIPRRLWERLVNLSEIPDTVGWAQLSKPLERVLLEILQNSTFEVRGKSLNKEEFVTCGGVNLDEVNLRTMESRKIPGLFFAGEVLDVDGITGGFNFQNAWTTGYLAGTAISMGK
ncbi:MAG: NAD(P)/FAD-dependent oxidoreductase [Verrucomicrobia bacterium]|nr:NAD(P)/FAD-dependent oxidoreductase [Verrucomicrobiota bacterium]MDA1065089.1 NAD(P)/FAD-dependent oxidoreductase [Verrucomicrobiota bacterium]